MDAKERDDDEVAGTGTVCGMPHRRAGAERQNDLSRVNSVAKS